LSTRKAISLALSTVVLAASAVMSAGPATATPSTGEAAPAAAPAAVPAAATPSGDVTLITGDRVRVGTDGAATIIAKTRPDVRFSTYQHAGRTHVIPSDAAALLAAGALDERFFDVTGLLEAGYDTRRGSLPLIVVSDERGRSALTAGGTRIRRELPAVRAVAVESRHTAPLWNAITAKSKLRPGITRVWLDGKRRIALDQSVPQVGAPAAWSAGFTGTGVKVAVVDTGIDATHPDLTGKVTAAQNFTTESDTVDRNGHGTHVASTIAGTGAASGGVNKGVAPGANLLSAKVCTEDGGCAESAIIAGMNWAAQQGADVVNMSLGGRDTSGVDPLEQAVNTLTASSGTLFVIAAGNDGGAGESTLNSPGTADAALTVGAVDSGDNLAGFSSRGPRVGDVALKPDITAPGVDITAARSSASGLPGGSYTDLSGTSMATPHVAGAAAVLAQRRPTWTPAQLKAGLMAAAAPQANTAVFSQGAGRLRVDREINQTVLSNPPSITLGRQIAPHADDPVLTRTVQYQNTGTSGVSLTLTLNAVDPYGSAAPAGMFALNTGTVTVPAGGTASVTFTTDTRVDGPEGLYGGWISATGPGGLTVSTPFGVHRADGVEMTFHLRNRSGQYAPRSEIMMIPVGPVGQVVHMWELPAQPITAWVPSGVYVFKAMLPEDDDFAAGATVMINARMVVSTSSPAVQNIDAAGGGLVEVTVPNPNAVREVTEVAGQLTENGWVGLVGHAFLGSPGINVYTKQYGATSAPGFVTKIRRQTSVPGPVNIGYNQPTIYNTAWFPTTFPTGWSRNVTAAQLATVNSQHWAHVPGGLGGKGINAQPGSEPFRVGIVALNPFNMPFTRTEYYNTESGVRWQAFFTDYLGTNFVAYVDSESAPTTYTAGTTTSDLWNKPVYGPALGTLLRPENHVVRSGDFITMYPPLLSDSEGHAGHLVNGAPGTLTLKRGSEVLGTWPYPTYAPGVWAFVAPELTTYTLEASLTRDAPAVLSTQVSAVWTFRSSTAPGGGYTRLPLWYAIFKPNLNSNNSAPAGTTFDIPLTAAAQPTSSPGSLSTVAVQYSTNGGSTWTNATLTGSGANRTARVTHPSGSGFVSLRVTVTDSAGNGVTQTLIRAYRFG
jgi:subtilisin family serine protease